MSSIIKKGLALSPPPLNSVTDPIFETYQSEKSDLILGSIKSKTEFEIELEKPLKVQRNWEDLLAQDINQRTLLHRAALEQNYELLSDILREFETMLNQRKKSEESLNSSPLKGFSPRSKGSISSPKKNNKIKSYEDVINLLDKFGNSPLINAVSQNLEDSQKQRSKCVKLLLECKANVNIKNKRTLWSVAHWIAYHGDEIGMTYLLNNPYQTLDIHFPDYMGFYPLDLAGKNGNVKVAIQLIDKLIFHMEEYIKESETKAIFDEFWESPFLKTSILFWAVHFKCKKATILSICNWRNTYIECPMFLVHETNPIHVAAQNNSNEILDSMINICQKKIDDLKSSKTAKTNTNFTFLIENNDILSLKNEKTNVYSIKFKEKIKKYAKWKFRYEDEILRKRDKSENQLNIFFDAPDMYGNTPLHLASMVGNEEGVRILISKGCDIDKVNKEGFTPRELTQMENIKKIYQEEYYNIKADISGLERKKKEKMEEEINSIFLKFSIEKKIVKRSSSRRISQSDSRLITNSKEGIKELISEKNNIYSPDFVIKFKKNPNKNNIFNSIKSQLKDKNNLNDPEVADRLNFYITLLINARFEVYLAPSIDDNFYYIMLTLNEDELYTQCQNQKMRLKLIDSYNYEIFEKKNKVNFEPLRSRQRQEIISKYIGRIIDLEMLKNEDLIESYFLMHSHSGINLIRRKWISTPKFYWPQPLNQLDDYFIEGKGQNFSSVTSLRQYLGEKISFFFAWKSFTTCFLLFLAIPGTILQAFLVYQHSYNSELLPFWVFYVSLWSTIIVEFWKRKCSEINTRWGAVQLMNNESTNEIRKEFSGDEFVSNVTGELTKYQEESKTIWIFLGSLPVLIVLLGCCIATFFLSEEYKKYFAGPNSEHATIHNVIAGALNGTSITILNFLYTYIARWFVNKENHKFDTDYERSLIIKSFAFRFLNSYFAVFYVGFINQDFEQLFFTLLPILIYKQLSNLGLHVIKPWLVYKYRQRKYFKLIKKKALKQHQSKDIKDPILKASNIFGNYSDFYSRVVIYLNKSDKNENENMLINDCDMDSVELNSCRESFHDTVDYYSESFISFGYVTMLTAAFPIGPMIALVVDTFELKWKIYSFLFALKRPLCEKSSGIGLWIDIWEGLSLISVVSNFFLILFNNKIQFASFNIEVDDDMRRVYRLWVVVIMVTIIILCKFMFRALIEDKPKWVRDEEERLKAKQDKKGVDNFSKNKSDKELAQHLAEQKDKYLKQLEKEHKKNAMLKYELDDLVASTKNRPREKSLFSLPIKSPALYKSRLTGIFEKTFKILEREILTIRLEDISRLENGSLFICDQCHKLKALFECLQCKIYYCKQCLEENHIITHSQLGKDKPIVAFIEKKEENKEKTNKNSEYKIRNRKEYYEKLLNKNIGGEKKIKRVTLADAPKKYEWKKFEYFSLPVYEKSESFKRLKEAFEYLKEIYLITNGITDDMNIDIDEFLQREPEKMENEKNVSINQKFIFPEIKSKIKRIKNQKVDDFLNLEGLNIEDKLFLNRIMFALARKSGAQMEFSSFYKMCKKLEEGGFIQKIILLTDILEFEDNIIEKIEFKRIISASFIRNIENEEIDFQDIINEFFQGQNSVTKQNLIGFFSFINPNDNTAIVTLLKALLQIKNDKKKAS